MIGPNVETAQAMVIVLNGPPPPLDCEFKQNDFSAIFGREGLSVGRCFGSKSGYLRSHPRAVFVPNANVFCRRHGKVWWGDLDLRSDKPALERVARRLRCRLYVLDEADGRFTNATLPHEAVIRRARWHTGGLTFVPSVGRFLRHSGLRVSQLALLANARVSRLTQRQQPEIALEAYRRLVELDDVFRAIAGQSGYDKWGKWWTSAKDNLRGESPLAALISGRSITIGTFMAGCDDSHAFRFYELLLMLSGKRL